MMVSFLVQKINSSRNYRQNQKHVSLIKKFKSGNMLAEYAFYPTAGRNVCKEVMLILNNIYYINEDVTKQKNIITKEKDNLFQKSKLIWQ